MVFKVEFDKAYDSISWDYLLRIMEFMGFHKKWLCWVKACLLSFRAFILINQIFPQEFSLQRGLHQGDPMASFLFITVMEGLHVAKEDAIIHRLFRGVSVGAENFIISYFFYADDVLFIREWEYGNIVYLITILNHFYLVIDLKINLRNSNLFELGVFSQDVEEMAVIRGCLAASFPFYYLGVSIGINMGFIEN